MLTNVPTLPIVKANPDERAWKYGVKDSVQYLVMGQVLDSDGKALLLLAEMGHKEIKFNRELVPALVMVEVELPNLPSDLL